MVMVAKGTFLSNSWHFIFISTFFLLKTVFKTWVTRVLALPSISPVRMKYYSSSSSSTSFSSLTSSSISPARMWFEMLLFTSILTPTCALFFHPLSHPHRYHPHHVHRSKLGGWCEPWYGRDPQCWLPADFFYDDFILMMMMMMKWYGDDDDDENDRWW